MKRLVTLLALLPLAAVAQVSNLSCIEVGPSQLNPLNDTLASYCIDTKNYPTGSVPILIGGNQQAELHGNLGVTINPGFCAGDFATDGKFVADAGYAPMEVVNLSANPICTYEKLEFGLALPPAINDAVNAFLNSPTTGAGLNPFDPADLDIVATFHGPSGQQFTTFGFYFEDFLPTDTIGLPNAKANLLDPLPTLYPWRVRFACPENGTWYMNLSVTARNVAHLTLDSIAVQALDCGDPGYVRTGLSNNNNDHYLLTDNGDSWFAIGGSMPAHIEAPRFEVTVASIDYFQEQMDAFAAVGGNFVRLWASPVAFGVEWEQLGNYATDNSWQPGQPAPLTISRQGKAWILDRVFDMAEQHDMKLMLCLEVSFQFHPDSTWPPTNWAENPYHLQIPTVTEPLDYFTDATAREFTQRKLRYMVARYGYSKALGMYELFNEVDLIWDHDPNIGYDDSTQAAADLRLAVSQWHDEMGRYIKQDLHDTRHPVTTSFAGGAQHQVSPWVMDHIDVLQRHSYASDWQRDLTDAKEVEELLNTVYPSQAIARRKPVICGEQGSSTLLDECTPMHLHTILWSSLFTGAFGTGMHFGLHWLEKNNRLGEFQPIAAFAEGINWQREWVPERWQVDNEAPYYRSFQLRSGDKKRSMGWVRNLTYSWSNLGDSISCAQTLLDDDLALEHALNHEDGFNAADPSPMSEEEVTIEGLKSLRNYTIEWYSTAGSAPMVHSETKLSGINGKLHVEVPATNMAARDWAWKAYRSNLSGSKAAPGTQQAQVPESVQLASLPEAPTLYPNPAQTSLTVRAPMQQGELRVVNSHGALVLRQSITAHQTVLNIAALPAGLYLVTLQSTSATHTLKFIKQ